MKKKLFFLLLFFLPVFLFLPSFSQNYTKIDSLEAVLATSKEDTVKVNVLNILSKEYRNKDSEKAIQLAEKALALAKKSNYKNGISAGLNSIGLLCMHKGDYEKSIRNFQEAIELLEEQKEKKRTAPVLMNIGNVYKFQGKYKKAIEYYQRSLKIEEEFNNQDGVAANYDNIATIYAYEGSYDKSIEYFLKALKIVESLNNKEGIANGLNNIGIVYGFRGNMEKALDFFLKSLKIREELNDRRGTATSLINISTLYLDKKEYDKALEMYTKALTISEELGDKSAVSTSLNGIGATYKDLGQYDKSLEYYFKSVKLDEEIGNKQGCSFTYNNIGKVYFEKKEYSKALEYFQESLEIAIEIGFKEQIKYQYESLSHTYAKLNNYSKAYHYHQLYAQIKDSLLNESNSKQIVEMQTKYETDKKEKEIELLTKDKSIQELELSKRESDLNKQRILSIASTGGLLLILAFAFLLYNRNKIKQKANEKLSVQNEEIKQQKEIIEEKNKDITDSINYASRIQQAILPEEEELNKLLPDSFILFKPKDIVSGDFYWLAEVKSSKEEIVLFAAVDCTGHGVPGAFMSMIGTSILNEVVNEKGIIRPGEILGELRKGVVKALKQRGEAGEQQDGMDISLCSWNKNANKLEYAGAYNPLYLIRNNELKEIKADKQPIGGVTGKDDPFINNEVTLEKGDTVYVFTDGYADQFGGPKGKKFKYSQMQALLLSIQKKPMAEQKLILDKTLEAWRGNIEQVDDICMIGMRV